MSLTRDEWCEVWESLKKIERLADYLYTANKIRSDQIKDEVFFLKRKVQSVIGQME